MAYTDTRMGHLLSELKRDLQDGRVPHVRVADLARAAGVSVRTVYRASARHLGGPPVTQIRHLKLQEARRRLLTAAPGETVTSAAMDAGFFHLGRFSAVYRRRFGESPSQTLRRARTSAQALLTRHRRPGPRLESPCVRDPASAALIRPIGPRPGHRPAR